MTRHRIGGRSHPRRLVAMLLGLTACLLAGDIAFVALSLAGPLGLAGAPEENAAAVATAERFYAAVSSVIATGDPAPLAAVVAPFYVEHAGSGDAAPPGPDGLVAAALRLRALAPALRIAVLSAAATSGESNVTVRLRVTGAETGAFLGLALPRELAAGGWGPIEIVRVAEGKIAERWSWPESTARLEPLVQAVLPPTDGTPRVTSVMRLALPPNAEVQIDNGLATRFLFVESGALTIGMQDTRPGSSAPPPTTGLPLPAATAVEATRMEPLSTGDQRLTLPGEHSLLANDGDAPASLLVVTRFGVGSGTASPNEVVAAAKTDVAAITSSGPGSIDGAVLGVAILATKTAQTLALGQVTMSPDSSLTWALSQAPIVIAVDQGQLTLTGGETATGMRADGRPWQSGDALLAPGDAAEIAAATTLRWQTAALPATVIVLALSPATPNATPTAG